MINILHQLLKRTVTYLVLWLELLIEENVSVRRKKKDVRDTVLNVSDTIQFDQWFHFILVFSELKRFDKYSVIKQWTESDWKSVIHQIVSVVASLLTQWASAAMQFTQAVVDFVILSQYSFHDNNTLQYLQHALFWMNRLKNIFHHLHSVNSDINTGHFNLLKLYVMTHYAEHIWQYNTADNVDTEHSEAAHKYLVKAFFNQINKWEDFQEQLMHYNTHHVNLLTMKNLILWKNTWVSEIKKNAMSALITYSSWVISLSKFSDLFMSEKMHQIWCTNLDLKLWYLVSTLDSVLNISELLDTLMIFVCKCQNAINEINIRERNLNCRVKDSSDIESYHVCVHNSLKCWKRDKKNVHDLKSLVFNKLRCAYS